MTEHSNNIFLSDGRLPIGKILVACEESQAVTIEFRKLGYEAYSCDLMECSGGHPEWHIKGDAVAEAYSGKYDMMLCFTPCTHLAVSGARWFKEKIADGRQKQGIDLFMSFVNAPIDKIAIENPIGIMSTKYRKPNQIIQPWEYGHGETKSTCLWLKNLPNLEPTNIVEGRHPKIWLMTDANGKKLGWNTPEIKKARSKTYPGIAQAMADQWTRKSEGREKNIITANTQQTLFEAQT